MIELTVLGRVDLRVDELQSVDDVLRRPKRLALLLYLVLARRYGFHSRDELLALFWPDATEDRARTSLRQALQVLREALGPDVILSRGRTDVAIDRTRLHCDAVALLDRGDAGDDSGVYTAFMGELAPGFMAASVSAGFERWLDGERLRIRQRVLAAIGTTLEKHAGNRPTEAIALAQRAVEIDPSDERAHQRLIRLLANSGDRVGAIAAYERLLRYADEHLAAKPSPETYGLIREVRGRQPVPATEPVHEVPDVLSAKDVDAPPPISRPESSLPRERDLRPSRRRFGAAILVVFSLLLVVLWRFDSRPAAASSMLNPHRIAVLYFEDLSESQLLRHVAAGLTEGLIHELTQVPRLEVISAAGVRPWRDSQIPVDTLLRRFRAGTVIEGSVQQVGDSVRATIRLSNVETLTQLTSQVVTVLRQDVVELQARVVEATAHELRKALGESVVLRRLRTGTNSPKALEDLLRARQLREDALGLASSSDPTDMLSLNERLSEADSLSLAAMRAAPRWPEPQLLSGWLSLDRARVNTGPARVRASNQAVRTAVELTARFPQSAPTWELRGVAEWRKLLASPEDSGAQARAAGAEDALRKAVSLDPTLADAWGTLAVVLVFRGALGEAESAAQRALREDAYYRSAADVMYQIGLGSLTNGDHARAHTWCERGEKEFPQDFRFVDCELNLLRDESTRDPRRARELEANGNRLDPALRPGRGDRSYNHIFRRMIVASVFAASGQRDSAQRLLAESRREVRDDAERSIDLHFDESYLQLVVGDTATGLARLGDYLAARPNLSAYVARDPLFRALRDHPEFRRLTIRPEVPK